MLVFVIIIYIIYIVLYISDLVAEITSLLKHYHIVCGDCYFFLSGGAFLPS